MNHAKDIQTEKHLADLESAKVAPKNDNTAEENILEPLQFLLAARRGVHQDPSFASSHVPDDRAIIFKGPSGVKPAVDRASRWSRFVRYIGYLPTSSRVVMIWSFFYAATEYGTYTTKLPVEGTTRTKGDIYYGLKLGLLISCIVLALLIAAGRTARKQTIAAIPPEFDPESYQCRLLNAMQQRGYHYREIDVISLEKKMAYWKRDPGHRECFTIKGLVDPGCQGGGVYDVVVNFWKDGRLNLRFWTGEESLKDGSLVERPSLILESGGKS
ncbi:uncharacterized protein N7496_006616 [Penicillium cataractarum]|uniref:Uncharacterized protein n=1 Tax=Penicillium cataractarum TaxID=2100454 RepID=A0A9W9V7K7_9EURO|nr:uncharacterized protein N7496_006616 [Penicillium cataractarum]KAJ5370524.1 hypothetical protein N7496_006616 [Penicillium cataractarum]